jgi:hypothetical protein
VDQVDFDGHGAPIGDHGPYATMGHPPSKQQRHRQKQIVQDQGTSQVTSDESAQADSRQRANNTRERRATSAWWARAAHPPHSGKRDGPAYFVPCFGVEAVGDLDAIKHGNMQNDPTLCNWNVNIRKPDPARPRFRLVPAPNGNVMLAQGKDDDEGGSNLDLSTPKSGAAGCLRRNCLEEQNRATAEAVSRANRVPNPWGKRGSPAHRARIEEAQERFTSNGWDVVSGGTEPERRYGSRYPDLVLERNNKRIAFQVGRVTKAGRPIPRERRALADLQGTGEFDNIYYLAYGK